FKGSVLVGALHEGMGLKARHPFRERDSVLLPADYVTTEQGTGCVHTAPGHGQEDYGLGLEFGLDVLAPVNQYGKFMEAEVPEFANMHVFKANPEIAQMLHDSGMLLNQPGDKVTIDRYPHGWRSKKPVIFRATTQWFIAMEPEGARDADATYALRERALAEIDTIDWLPAWGRNRIHSMVEGRPDWCISRQRSWGVPITAMHCNDCGHVIATKELADHVADLVEDQGVDVWFALEPKELMPEHLHQCPGCGGDSFSKEEDILDVWWDSGVSWSAVVGKMLGHHGPADLYLEGSDQHRGWFQSSLMASLLSRDHAPYKTCLTHGFIMDENGRKYSKSSKNFEPPEKMLKQYGAEVLRFWVASADYRGDITLGNEPIKGAADAYRKVRNTVRFMLGNLDGFDPAEHRVALEELEPLDRWMLAKVGQALGRIHKAFEEYQFHTIYHTLVGLMTVELSNVFLDISKDRMYCERRDSPRRRSGQTAFWLATDALLRAMAPLLSFTAQEAWELMPKADDAPQYVFWADFPADASDAWSELVDHEEWDAFLAVRDEVNKAMEAKRGPRKNKGPDQIGSSQEADVLIKASGETLALLKRFEDRLVEYFIVAHVHLTQGDGDLEVTVKPSGYVRCPRCWNHWVPPGSEEGALCERCASVLAD
ncbi:MAG: class I tRNA ligase family protein, partial [Myxococcota bacterium]